jgi:hypothetical protein
MRILAADLSEDGIDMLPRGWDGDGSSILDAYNAILYAIYKAIPKIRDGAYDALMVRVRNFKTLYVPAQIPRTAFLTSISQDFGCSCIHHEGAKRPV